MKLIDLMGSGHYYSAQSSLRRGNSNVQSSLRRGNSIFLGNAGDVFWRSVRDEDDEEALKWAALERLPTTLRLRKGILTTSRGGFLELDVKRLGLWERKILVERLVKVVEEDNERFLLRLRDRIERVGIKYPTIEVRFEHLSVEAEAYVGTKALPTFFNYYINMVEGLLNYLHILPSRKKQLQILKDVTGIIKPSRMTLLLGPPSSGKTTLLLALAGRLDPTLKFSGRMTYNGHDMNEFEPERTAAYISQHDTFLGEMTVRETLAFSARCQGVGSRYDMLSELSRREKIAGIKPDPEIDFFMKAAATEGQEANVVVDYVLKVLGLEVCADTMVGDEMIRGVSGGQRKRVTTGEMLVGPATVFFMDEISTGLDSSTTYQIVKTMRQCVHILKETALISLLQPAPETYDLFDDIILLSDGQIVYQGPREDVLYFFEFVGFKCPERKGVADFLQEVTSKKDQEQYWARKDVAYKFITVQEFVEAFQSFSVGRRLRDELAAPFDKSKSHPAALITTKYGVSKKELLKACFAREYLLMKRNSFFFLFKFFQLMIMAFVTMTLFLRTEMHRDSVSSGGRYAGALFFSVVMIMFNGMAELPMTLLRLPVFYKQRDLRFFPAWAYALPTWILQIPITFLEVAIWVFMTYFVIGYDPSVERLFKQYLAFLLINQMASSLFRAISASCRDIVVSNTLGSFVLLLMFILGGFVLSRDNIKDWLKWTYWLSPMMYGQNVVVINEFLGKSWSHVLPNSTEPLGLEVLKARGFFREAYWYWIGVGALLGFTFLFNFIYGLALTFLNPFQKSWAVISEEPQCREPRIGGSFQLENSATSSGSKARKADAENGKEMSTPNIKRGMVLPFEPHSITFNDITYAVDMPQEMKSQGIHEDKLVLLKGVSGAFRPGVLTALMGVSGAGKTTLMDVLAGRKTRGYIEGSITISGYPKKQETFARISGYCEQNDIHSPHVTVYESLLFSAWLRLPAEVDSKTRTMFVEQVMELVEMNPLRQSLVGLPGVNGLSTEQRKRLTIAVELVANPSIIFMDEPTSGLDARAAAIVMRTVRNTVDTGRTVVCTIHQPSIDIFESFDELFLMKRGGEEIYVGSLGHHSCHLINYFEGIQGVSKIKDGYNPATWMLEVTTEAQEAVLGVDFADVYRRSEVYRRNKALITDLTMPTLGSEKLHFSTQYAQSFFNQCLACLWKQHRSYWCNPTYTAVRLFFTTFMALIFGTMFWGLGSNIRKEQDLFNAMGSLYTAVFFLGIQNSQEVQNVVAVERTVFYREKAAGMYSAFPYAFGQVVIEVPHIFVQSAVFGVIVYAMNGYEWDATKFFWNFYFVYFTLLYCTFYGMMTLAVSPNQEIGTIISTAFYALWNLFSGFVVPRPSTPVWWRWYCYICPIAWTLYGLIASQYGDIKETLESGETVEQFLKDYFDFRHDFLGVVAVIVLGFTVLFAFIFAFCIKVFNFQRR